MLARYKENLESGAEPLPVAELKILSDDPLVEPQTVECVIDSGADATALPGLVLDGLGINAILCKKVHDYKDESEMRRGRLVRLKFFGREVRSKDQFGNDCEWVWVVELPDHARPILGRDVLNQFVVTLNGPELVCEIE